MFLPLSKLGTIHGSYSDRQCTRSESAGCNEQSPFQWNSVQLQHLFKLGDHFKRDGLLVIFALDVGPIPPGAINHVDLGGIAIAILQDHVFSYVGFAQFAKDPADAVFQCISSILGSS